jgi:hypothetical protein
MRRDRLVTRILGPYYRTNTSRIEIDITWACNLLCMNCNRSCRQAATTERMSVSQISRFVSQSVAKGKQWEKIRIVGGEPTLHPDLPEIIAILNGYRRVHSPGTEIMLVTNGVGAAAENLSGWMPRDVLVVNTAKSDHLQADFEPFNMAPDDMPECRRMSFANGCRITRVCGLGLTSNGYYPCGIAGGIDRIWGFGLGMMDLPEDGGAMVPVLEKICRLCGHFLNGRRALDRDRSPALEEPMSKQWLQAYQAYAKASPLLPRY